MLRTTLAGLRMHSARYVTTALAILLGVMFVAGTMVFADTLNASYEESVMGSATSVDVVAVPEADEDPEQEPAELSEELLDDVRSLPEIAEADGKTEGQAVLLDDEGRALGVQPPFALSFGDVNRYSADEGDLPDEDDEVALATSVADQGGFGVGDTVTVLDPAEEEREFTVSGLVNFGVEAPYNMAGALVLTPGTAQQVAETSGYAEIDATAAEGYTDQEAAEAVAAVTGAAAEVDTGEEFGLALAESTGAQTEMLRVSLLLFGLIAMFVAGLVIYNTFAILIAQRQRELALLRLVGAQRSQVFRSVLTESVVVGLTASGLGVLAGAGAGYLGVTFGGPMLGTETTAAVVVTPAAVIAGLTVGTLVTVASALVPALRATRVAPLAALRTSASAAGLEKNSGRLRVVAGILLFAASAAMVALSQAASGPNEAGPVIVTGAALVAFAGVVVLGPLLVRGTVRLAGIPLRRTGVSARLAVDNSVRSPRRAATAMIALTVGATLITGYSVISATTEATMTETLEEQFPMDYQVAPQFGGPEADDEPAEGPEEQPAEDAEDDGAEADPAQELFDADGVPDEVRAELEADPIVDGVVGERSEFPELGDQQRPVVSTYFGGEVGADVTSETVAGDLSDLGPGTVALEEHYADGHEVGGTYELPVEDGADLSLEIVAVLEEGQALRGAVIDTEDFTTAFPHLTQDENLRVSTTEDADPAEAREAVYAAVDDHPTVQVTSLAEIKNQFSEVLDIAFYTIAAMLGLAILIAVFGISNTMALSVLERTRESALLRALGLSRGQLRRMLSVEAVLLCLIGAGIGIVFGVVFGWAAAASVLPSLTFTVPAGQIGAFIAASVLAGLLSAVLPARRAAKTSITGALASD